MIQPVSKDRSVSCNGTGWSSQYLRIGQSVVIVQGDPARSKDRSVSWYRVIQPVSKDRSVSCNGTGWSSQYLRIGPSVVMMVQGGPASI